MNWTPSGNEKSSNARRLQELALLFLKLGTIGFGGPAAHIAMMEEEVVRRRRWLTREEFLDLVGATNLIPGPNSTELAIHIGLRRAGMAGLLVAGLCFILPAVILVLGCGWIYVSFGKIPQVQGILYGVKPVIIFIVAQALWNLGKSALKTKLLLVVSLAIIGLAWIGLNELILLLGAGMFVALASRMSSRPTKAPAAFLVPLKPLAAAAAPITLAGATVPHFGIGPLFLFFLKVGSVLYGSGYVLLAFLRSGLVERFGWLTENELLDAVAVGQITPGPVFTTATFIGYILGGTPAALAATIGIFLPAFIFVAISGPLVPRIRRSPIAGAFLDGVNAASLALMAVVTFQLTRAALVDWFTVCVALAAAFLLLRYRWNTAWLVAGGAGLGLLRVLLA